MFSRLPSLLLCLTLASGCVNTVDIDAEDNNARFANLTASAPLGSDAKTRVRFKATRVDGRFDQELDFDENIRFDDVLIGGPGDFDGDIDLAYYSIAIGRSSAFGGADPGGLRTETYLGVAQTRFDLELQGPLRRLEAEDDTVEFYMQWVAFAPIGQRVDFGFSWALSLGRDFSGINEIDLMLEFEATEHLMINGGYRWLEYNYDSGDFNSDIKVDFRGPFLGVRIPF